MLRQITELPEAISLLPNLKVASWEGGREREGEGEAERGRGKAVAGNLC